MAGPSNNRHSPVIRGIFYRTSYELSAESIGFDLRTLDDKLNGLLFAIARVPEFFPPAGQDPNRGTLYTARYLGDPPLIVWFTYDADRVDMWFVTKAEVN